VSLTRVPANPNSRRAVKSTSCRRSCKAVIPSIESNCGFIVAPAWLKRIFLTCAEDWLFERGTTQSLAAAYTRLRYSGL
jgi:hypothetical protein